MATKHGYGRKHLGGGHVVKAVTRTRRAAAGQVLGVTASQVKRRNREAYLLSLVEQRWPEKQREEEAA